MSFKYYDEGTKVKGEYYGVPFTGEVYHRRPHTINDTVLFYVRLDKPLKMPEFMNPEGTDFRDKVLMTYPYEDDMNLEEL